MIVVDLLAGPDLRQRLGLDVADDQLGLDVAARARVDVAVREHDGLREEQLARAFLERHRARTEADFLELGGSDLAGPRVVVGHARDLDETFLARGVDRVPQRASAARIGAAQGEREGDVRLRAALHVEEREHRVARVLELLHAHDRVPGGLVEAAPRDVHVEFRGVPHQPLALLGRHQDRVRVEADPRDAIERHEQVEALEHVLVDERVADDRRQRHVLPPIARYSATTRRKSSSV
jgi:hypothetical protein